MQEYPKLINNEEFVINDSSEIIVLSFQVSCLPNSKLLYYLFILHAIHFTLKFIK